jgi:hypothetical protein
MVVGPRQAVP